MQTTQSMKAAALFCASEQCVAEWGVVDMQVVGMAFAPRADDAAKQLLGAHALDQVV